MLQFALCLIAKYASASYLFHRCFSFTINIKLIV